jgi:hypothetical protein
MKIIKKLKIFLGGTCPSKNFDYRKELIPMLENEGFSYFNPIVENWTEENQKKEEEEKIYNNIHLYLISPDVIGMYSIAEMFASLFHYGENKKVIFVLMKSIGKNYVMNEDTYKNLESVGKLFSECGGLFYKIDSNENMEEVLTFLE